MPTIVVAVLAELILLAGLLYLVFLAIKHQSECDGRGEES